MTTKTASRRQQSTATPPPIIAHIAPDWAIGNCMSLCGLPVRVSPADIPPHEGYIVCALCEAAMMLDGMPDKPGTWSQQRFF